MTTLTIIKDDKFVAVDGEGLFLDAVVLASNVHAIQFDGTNGTIEYNDGTVIVALDVTISEELRKEGVARELINRIQNARKDKGLEVTDRIKLTVLKFEDLEESINNNKEYIMSETLTDELVFVDQLIDGSEIEFDTIKSKILIHKM